MKPVEFLLLGNTLLANQAEAAQRSAVSRAYYGAFNAAKDLIESCGISFPKSAETHQKLFWCLEQSGDLDVKYAGGKLKSLRDIRNSADYEMDDRRFFQRDFAALHVKTAREVYDAISLAEARVESFKPLVRRYAKDALRMSLRDED